MPFDAHANLAYSRIALAPVPALTGVSIDVTAGSAVIFPAAPFNCTIWPAGTSPLLGNAEIVRVTAVVGDTFTIVRAQEGTTAKAITVGYQIANTVSVKVITDIENSIIQGISAGLAVATASQVVFADGNGVSFGVAGQTVTASVAGGGGGGITNINISAGTTSQNLSAVTFSNSNGISFGLDAALSRVTASYTVPVVPAQSTQPVAASASNGSFLFSTVAFSNANNVTFGTSAGSIITASVAATVAQSTQPVAASASNGSFLFSTLAFSNANGVTFGTSAGSIISASVGAGASPGSISAGTTSVALGQVVFSNSNNVSFALNGSTVTATVTVASTQGSVMISAGTTSNSGSQFVFSNSNNVSFGLNGSTITATATVTQSNQNVTAANGGFAFQTLSFSNANNVSFSTSAGSAVVASATVASTQGSIFLSAGTTSNSGSQFVFSNSNNVSFGMNGSTITASATVASTQGSINFSAGTTSGNLQSVVFSDANGVSFGLNGSTITASRVSGLTNINVSAGTTSNNLSAITFSNANGVTFGLNGSTLTASVAAGGGAQAYVGWLEPYGLTNTAQIGPVAGSWYFAPFVAPQAMSGGRINFLHQNQPATSNMIVDVGNSSYNSTNTGTLVQSYTYSKAVALYSQGSGTNSTRLESLWSNSFSWGWSKSVVNNTTLVSNLNITVAHSVSYISEVGSNGAYTLNQYANSSSSSILGSITSGTIFSDVASSIRNLISNSVIEFVGMNTTIQPGAYWLAFAWSTTRATAATGGLLSTSDFGSLTDIGISRIQIESIFRNWGSTVTTNRSHIMPYGAYTGAANMAPPANVALQSDLMSLASAWIPYFNFQNNGITN